MWIKRFHAVWWCIIVLKIYRNTDICTSIDVNNIGEAERSDLPAGIELDANYTHVKAGIFQQVNFCSLYGRLHALIYIYECTQTHAIYRNCISKSIEGQKYISIQICRLAYCWECCSTVAAARFNWKLNCQSVIWHL